MADGSKSRIDQIAAGDYVFSRQSETDASQVTGRVKQVFIHDVDGYHVINNGLEVTSVHRVFTQRGWLTVSQLEIGDRLLNQQEEWVEIETIEKESRSCESL